MPVVKNAIWVTAALLGLAADPLVGQQQEVPVPRSTSGDQGRYTLLSVRRAGDIVQTIHRRAGPSATGYTKMEINCRTRMVRDLGYSEESVAGIKGSPSQWYELTRGSSKSDVAAVACRAK